MFKVRDKVNDNVYDAYDIYWEKSSGETYFLIYFGDRWSWINCAIVSPLVETKQKPKKVKKNAKK